MRKVVLLLTCISIMMQTTHATVCCPDKWISYGSHCYLIGYGKSMTFLEANLYCSYVTGGYLVRVDTIAENRFLTTYLKEAKVGNVWMGLHDITHEGKWHWYGTSKRPSYFGWGSGQPNKRENYDCVYISSSGAWTVYPCHYRYVPVCEKP